MKTINNFRDFGGYSTTDGRRIRQGWLYRSGDLDRAHKADLKTLQDLHLQTIIDLRGSQEWKKGIKVPDGVRRVSLPVDIEQSTRERLQPLMTKKNIEPEITAIISQTYAEMVDHVQAQLGELLRLLLCAETYPVLIHCRAGKDRTGFTCAIIQLALGVERSVVVAEYLRSNEFILPVIQRMARRIRIFSLGLIPTQNVRLVYAAKEQYLCTALQRIEQHYGGLIPYLEQCGIGPCELARLQALLLEANPQAEGNSQ